MSDVSVEFGAVDVGLDKTLKAVQAEMTTLQTKIKSGDLAFGELEQTMKKLGQAEGLEKKLKSMGTDAAGTSPKIDALGGDLKAMGAKAEDAGDKGNLGLGKIGIAAGVAGAAVKVGMKAVELATDAARAVVDQFGAAIDLGGKLNDLSSRTGESAGNLLILERAFTNTGVSADAVGTSMNKMQKFMVDAAQGGAAQSEAMARLGVTMGDLSGKTPTEQMGVFAQRISSIQDPAQRAEAAMSIFGKSGGELLPILQNFSGEIEGAKGQLGGLPGVMDRSAAAFDGVGDNMAALSTKVLEFAAGFLESALPALNAFTSALSGVDAAGWGQATMDIIVRMADRLIGAFQNPMATIEAYGTSFEVAVKTFGNAFFNTSSTVIDFLVKSMETNLASAITAYIGSALTDAALTFGRHIIESLMTFSAAISELPGFQAAGDKMFEVLDAANTKLGEAQIANMGETAKAAGKVTEEFDKTASKTRVFKEDFFGAEDATKRMNAQMDAIEASGTATRTAMETAMVPATEGAKKVTQELNQQLDTTTKVQAAKQAELQYELELATAKATGNAAEQKALEERKVWLDAWKKATDSGMGEDKANAFANAMLRTKQITDSITGKDIIVTVTTTVEDKRWKTLLAEINSETATPHAIDVALKVTGQTDLIEARKILGLMENKNIEAAFKASGTDSLENLLLSLNSLPTAPQVDLAMKLTKTDNWDDALAQVKNIAPTKEVLLELKQQGFESVKAYKDSIEDLAKGRTAELTAKVMGAEYLDQAKAAVNGILESSKTPIDIKVDATQAKTEAEAVKSKVDAISTATPKIALDSSQASTTTSSVQNQIVALGSTVALSLNSAPADSTIGNLASGLNNLGTPVNLSLDGSSASNAVASVKTDISTLGAKQNINLDAASSITSIRDDLKSGIELDVSAKSGVNGLLEDLKNLVSDIKTLVGKIEPKLPVAALI